MLRTAMVLRFCLAAHELTLAFNRQSIFSLQSAIFNLQSAIFDLQLEGVNFLNKSIMKHLTIRRANANFELLKAYCQQLRNGRIKR